jgi:hypothetical protein
MTVPVEEAASTRAIRRLTVAIWALVVALFVNVAIVLWTTVLPLLVFGNHIGEAFSMGSSSIDIKDEFQGFSGWPLEKKIERASVIATTIYKKEDGKLKSMIVSIPKQAQNAMFAYAVGDEYGPESRYPRENTSYGDGEVIFFTGSPATMRESYTYSSGRIGGLGDMPLEKFTALVKAAK